MEIQRISKCIYKVNDKQIDIRKSINKNAIRFTGIRQAINIYFQRRNPNMYWGYIDARVCNLMNRNIKQTYVLENQTLFVK